MLSSDYGRRDAGPTPWCSADGMRVTSSAQTKTYAMWPARAVFETTSNTTAIAAVKAAAGTASSSIGDANGPGENGSIPYRTYTTALTASATAVRPREKTTCARMYN